MTFAELIPIALKLSIILLVFSLGLRADWADAISLFRSLDSFSAHSWRWSC